MYQIKRQRKNFTNILSNNIPKNYFPIVSEICIKTNENKSFHIITDRPEAGTSIIDGEIELLLSRYIYTDDSKGLAANITHQEKQYIHHSLIFTNKENEDEVFFLKNKRNFLNLLFIEILQSKF